MSSSNHHHNQALSLGGLLVALGIIYGDIGTSPLYVMKTIVGMDQIITPQVVLGGISAVFWTLTLQTTLKYVLIALRADNNGEGGIFSLYTLIRKKTPYMIVVAMIGGAALLADGIITPPISVSSAIEGLRILKPDIPTLPIVLAILTGLFAFQRFGTHVVGRSFGPIMFIWFSMLGLLGIVHVITNPAPLAALNPYYAWTLLTQHPSGFWVLGGVFLCTTGAEALYSDLGHCGRQNIQVSWTFVKTTLVLNYMGQGAWLLEHAGKPLTQNPFYAVMPDWFVFVGILIATVAAIIASQALISGSFTLVGEAIRLHLYPKVRVVFPSDMKGQLYIPSVNALLWLGCLGIMLTFRESEKMEAAYGLAITLAMMMTTMLLSFWLRLKAEEKAGDNQGLKMLYYTLAWALVFMYIVIEGAFLSANLLKFTHGGYVTLLISLAILFVMWVWLRSGRIKDELEKPVELKPYIPKLQALSKAEEFPRYCTHLVFLSKADTLEKVEQAVLYSIFNKQPKRADMYWFVHVSVTDEPHTMEYEVKHWAANDAISVHFHLGFRVPQRITAFLRVVINELLTKEEIKLEYAQYGLGENNIGDFRFVVLEDMFTVENKKASFKLWVMSMQLLIKRFTGGPVKWYGLDTSVVEVERVPLMIEQAKPPVLTPYVRG